MVTHGGSHPIGKQIENMVIDSFDRTNTHLTINEIIDISDLPSWLVKSTVDHLTTIGILTTSEDTIFDNFTTTFFSMVDRNRQL